MRIFCMVLEKIGNPLDQLPNHHFRRFCPISLNGKPIEIAKVQCLCTFTSRTLIPSIFLIINFLVIHLSVVKIFLLLENLIMFTVLVLFVIHLNVMIFLPVQTLNNTSSKAVRKLNQVHQIHEPFTDHNDDFEFSDTQDSKKLALHS